jgi:hypothetical protein
LAIVLVDGKNFGEVAKKPLTGQVIEHWGMRPERVAAFLPPAQSPGGMTGQGASK